MADRCRRQAASYKSREVGDKQIVLHQPGIKLRRLNGACLALRQKRMDGGVTPAVGVGRQQAFTGQGHAVLSSWGQL